MDARREDPSPATVTGTVMQLGQDHRVAFHLRNGTWWIAEFQGDRAELNDATTWARQVPSALGTHGLRAAALAATTELSPDLRERIEALHRRADEASSATSASRTWTAVARRWLEKIAASARRALTPRLDRS